MTQCKQRSWYLDRLRVFAAFFVVLLHISAEALNDGATDRLEWVVSNFYNCLAGWVVPVFVMVSGACFLGKGKELSLGDIFKKYILRLVTAYLFWSAIYAFFDGYRGTELIVKTVRGHYHMWFIPMIAGIYLLIPIFEKLVESQKLAGYFVVLAAVFGFLIPSAETVMATFLPHRFDMLLDALEAVVRNTHFHLALGYTGYFVLGFLLDGRVLSRKRRWLIYGLGAASVVLNVLLSTWLSIRKQAPISLGQSIPIFSFLESVAVYVWFRSSVREAKPKLAKLSGLVFGIYLIHPLVISRLGKLGITVTLLPAGVWIPLLTAGVFLISGAVIWLVKKIPVLHRYIT